MAQYQSVEADVIAINGKKITLQLLVEGQDRAMQHLFDYGREQVPKKVKEGARLWVVVQETVLEGFKVVEIQ